MTFGGAGGIWQTIGGLEQKPVTDLVARSIDAGVNFIDTADVYSDGRSEQMVGQALKDLKIKRSDVVIATKAYGSMGKGANDRGASRGHIMDAVEKSLERLGTDHIDLYQIHAQDVVAPVEETLRALDDLCRRGLVRYIGCSNWQAWKLMKALGASEREGWMRFESLQAYYSIAGRDVEREIVPLLQDQKVGLLVWSPLAGGLLSGKFGPGAGGASQFDGRSAPGASGPEGARRTTFDFPPVDRERAWKCVEVMRKVGAAHNASVARVALAYVLAKPWVTSIIIGAKTTEQLEDNLAAGALTLTADQLAELDAASALPPEYPGWMVSRQAAERAPKPTTK
jgi:aryl-alcohol dehydrogenase-like predicted oxidoreductase